MRNDAQCAARNLVAQPRVPPKLAALRDSLRNALRDEDRVLAGSPVSRDTPRETRSKNL